MNVLSIVVLVLTAFAIGYLLGLRFLHTRIGIYLMFMSQKLEQPKNYEGFKIMWKIEGANDALKFILGKAPLPTDYDAEETKNDSVSANP